MQETGFDPWVRKIPWWREWLPMSVFLPGELHGQRSLAGYSLWDRKELDTTEWLSLSLSHTHTRTQDANTISIKQRSLKTDMHPGENTDSVLDTLNFKWFQKSQRVITSKQLKYGTLGCQRDYISNLDLESHPHTSDNWSCRCELTQQVKNWNCLL